MLYKILCIFLFWANLCYAEEGIGSWYGNESICWQWGGYTRNGEKFDENALTCALPNKEGLNKYYKVTNLENNKSVIVWANDTGSFKKYNRIVDLSKGAFKRIGELKEGVIKVRMEVLNEKK
jgi:rare lipoprotein A